ncbi:MAG: GPW/gp25 family protein [bacterium]
MAEYIYFPLKPADLIQKKEHPRISLKDSVSQMIHMITITHFGEYKPDETLGCEIWDFDFDNITNYQQFKEQVKKSLIQTIEKQEPRLSQVSVDIQIQQVETRIQNRRTKSQITLKVNGILTKTKESYSYTENFFIGPLSYY